MSKLFNDLQIKEFLKNAVFDLGIEETTPIQEMAIPQLLEGRDIIGQAKTGTGKTFAYGIPLLNGIDVSQSVVQGLVILPTRELAAQVYNEFLKLSKYNKEIRVCLIVGGESYVRQFAKLKENPHIVVSTPGRTIDHMKRKTVDFSHVSFLVLDEADEMLKMGFQEDLETILVETPEERTTSLFSATIPPFIKKIASNYQRSPMMLEVKSKTLTANKIKQYYYFIKKNDRQTMLMKLLDFHTCESAIIFCNTKSDVDEVNEFLNKNDYSSAAIHGDLRQKERDFVLSSFRKEQTKFLIATDVAARGLDISHVDLVINYDLPYEKELYVHRIGRTGRADHSGLSISLVYPSSKYKMVQIEKFTNTTMEQLPVPTAEQINKEREEAIIAGLVEKVTLYRDTPTNPLIYSLKSKGFTETEILNCLLDTSFQAKTYKNVESIELWNEKSKDAPKRERRERDSEKRKRDGISASKRFSIAIVNVGKKESVNPRRFLDFLKSEIDIQPRNIGDIIINERDMKFEINKEVEGKLQRLNGKKFAGKVLNVLIVEK